jgi:hypothetical protein
MADTMTLDFTNQLSSAFTLGKINDGFTCSLSKDMGLVQSVSSPLPANGGNQSLYIAQGDSTLDQLKQLSPIAEIISTSGNATASVVWTNYDLKIRFGLSASIDTSVLENVLSPLGLDPTLTWSYMLDATPDQPVNWVQPNQTAPLTVTLQSYTLSITPAVNSDAGTIYITCILEDSSNG